jgi:flagellar biosynthetic protein FlhB
VSDDQGGERSFDPTPQRKEQFRKQGRFPKSKDAGSVVATLAVLAVVVGSEQAIGQAIEQTFLRCHGDLEAIGRNDGTGPFRAALGLFVAIAVPAGIAAAVAGTAIGLVQTGARVYTDNLGLDLTRLNPFPNLGRLFSPKTGSVQALLSILRVGFVGYIAYRALLLEIPTLLTLSRQGLRVGGGLILDAAVRVLLNALMALAAVAAIDYAQSRFTLGREMKMTRKEMTDENRSQEGDPKVKARIRARARARARRRSIENVKKATVVVANPTHVSVALRYAANDPAPILVAKGHDDFAMLIRAEARKHGVPILENRALARALDAEVSVGHAIPAAHFAAVAKILAFIYRAHAGGAGRGTQRA